VKRRDFLRLAGVSVSTLALPGCVVSKGWKTDAQDFPTLGKSAAVSRPNILFIMADDHARTAISCYGSKTIQTPGIDRLAREGLQFSRMTSTDSLCAPARAVLITGKYGHKNGVTCIGPAFDDRQPTFPKLLQQAGYETALFGKWHLISEPTGFDYFKVLPGQGRYFDCPLKEKGQPWVGDHGGVVHQGYLTDVLTDEVVAWLEHKRDASKPFCLMVHHKAAHSPHEPAPRHKDLFNDQTIPEPPTLLDDYAGRAPEKIADTLKESRLALCAYSQYRPEVQKFKDDRVAGTRHMYQTYMKGYLRLVAALDENIGRLLDHLDHLGLSKNTIVLYTSDNGFFNGEHGFFNKMWMYEPSLHLPLLVRWPGVVQPGTTNDQLVSMLDVAPTMVDLAGAPVPTDMQGVSFRPLLEGQAPAWRDAIYYHYYEQFYVPENYGVRTTRYKLIHYPKLNGEPYWELFDLENDLSEMHNLYNQPGQKEVVAQLTRRLQELRAHYGDTDQVAAGQPPPIKRKKRAVK